MSYFLNYVNRRIAQNKNFICCLTGGTGSGKSYSAVKMGEVLDPNFDVRNIVFKPEEFMDLVNGVSKTLEPGSVIVFDEIQVSMGHLDFQNLVSKCLNYIFQTFRHRNFILIMTSPHFDYINASLRKLFHSRIETVYINHKKKQCCLKPFLIQVNQRTGKPYNKYLKVNGVPVKRMVVGLASDELIKKYEAKKDKFTAELNKEIKETLQRVREKEKKKSKGKASMDIVLKYWKEGLTNEQMADKIGVTTRTIEKYRHKLRKHLSPKEIPPSRGRNVSTG